MRQSHIRPNVLQRISCSAIVAECVTALCRNTKIGVFLIREIEPDGHFGDIVALKPSKAEETLRKKAHTWGWCQGKMNLADDAFVGPFNFETISFPNQHGLHLRN
jgi:hypothetical protein